MTSKDILEWVRETATQRILFLPHALNQMNALKRMISTDEVRKVIFYGTVIEDYPEDGRGHSCLILGQGYENRPLHVVCAPKPDYLAVITAYLPNSNQWERDWRTRKKE